MHAAPHRLGLHRRRPRRLAASKDVWGNDVLGSPDGPTYAGIHRYLHPLLGVGRPAGLGPRRLTDSGVYYLAFGQPRGNGGAGEVQLHVADGSQIVSQLANGPSLTVSVGRHARERYGTCLSRLTTPRLADGYLPILETSYVDAKGVRYRQESFAARIPQTRALVSFVRLIVDPTKAKVGTAVVRFRPSVGHLKRVGTQLRQGTAREGALQQRRPLRRPRPRVRAPPAPHDLRRVARRGEADAAVRPRPQAATCTPGTRSRPTGRSGSRATACSSSPSSASTTPSETC